jgi:hypothetical protein
MGTVQIAMYAAAGLGAVRADAQLGDSVGGGYVYVEQGSVLASLYLGTVFGLDPCGRYHSYFGSGGAPRRCIEFWASLETQLVSRGLALMSGEGDPCDQFAVRRLREATAADQATDLGYDEDAAYDYASYSRHVEGN